MLDFCYEVTGNKDIMTGLNNHKFDLVLIDGSDPSRCNFIIPYKLDLKYISISARHDPWGVRVPTMPSGESNLGLYFFGDKPTFFQRLFNFAQYTALYLNMPPSIYKDAQISEMAPEKPKTTYRELYLKSEVFLVNNENMCIDYPRVEAPHYHFIGGIAAHQPNPLPKEFNDFYDKAEDGVILVSFGSLIDQATEQMMNKMFDVFKRLKQSIVMRYTGMLNNVPDNVMLAKWLPQNDLLGHPKTKLFITHGGNNGQMEGLYHGVQMLVVPFALDQSFNADRVVGMKLGKSLPPFTFETEELYDTLVEMLTNPIYSNNIKRCSRINKSFPSPHEKLNFWVNHVVEFGGDHLKPPYIDMPLYQYFMLDILLFLLCTTVASLYVTFRCCMCMKRKCCGVKLKTE